MGRKINSILTHQYTLALVYCAEIHAGQRRKGNATPYLAHLLSVSALVLEDGGDETEAIAALLHDSLEDQPDRTSREEIRQRFGEGAAQLVVACTDTPVDYHGGPKPPWRERKEKYLQHIRDGAGGAQRIVLADKLHNLRTMLADYRRVGEDLWPVFNAGKADQLWLYQTLVAAFAQAGVTPRIAEEVWPRANGVGLVRAGLGATFMCPSEARLLPPEVAFRPLQGPAPESRLVVGWKQPPDPPPVLAAFLSVAPPPA